MQGEEEDVADEQEPEGEDLVGGDGEDDSDEEVLSDNALGWTQKYNYFHRTIESSRRRGGGPMQGTSSLMRLRCDKFKFKNISNLPSSG